METLNVYLNKDEFINLICGTPIGYEHIKYLEDKKLGNYSGGFNDEWKWCKYKLEKLDIKKLYEIYLKIKK